MKSLNQKMNKRKRNKEDDPVNMIWRIQCHNQINDIVAPNPFVYLTSILWFYSD